MDLALASNEIDYGDRSLLPAVILEMIAVVGFETTIRLVKVRGGTRVYFPDPETLLDDHFLVDLIGREPTLKLCQHFTKDQLKLPKCDAFFRRVRDREIVRHWSEGAMTWRIAVAMNMSESQVWAILARERGDLKRRDFDIYRKPKGAKNGNTQQSKDSREPGSAGDNGIGTEAANAAAR